MSSHQKLRGLKATIRCLFASAGLLVVIPSGHGEDLVENGTFDDPEQPLTGWITDYEWTGNSYYVDNKSRVSVVDSEAGKSKVVRIVPAGDAGAKMECVPIKLEPGFRYTCSLDVKGGPYRIYFAGYKWQPGIRPHEDPELGELRLIYKSKATTSEKTASWTRAELSLPGVELSSRAKAALKPVAYITVYIWMMKPGHVDNITVTKTADPAMNF